jgi:two-component system sensor kinase FixL
LWRFALAPGPVQLDQSVIVGPGGLIEAAHRLREISMHCRARLTRFRYALLSAIRVTLFSLTLATCGDASFAAVPEPDESAVMPVGGSRVVFAAVISLVFVEFILLLRQHGRQQRLEQGLKAACMRLSLTTCTAQVGILELDSCNRALWANEQFWRLVNLAPTAALTLDLVITAVHPDDRHILREAVHSAAKSNALINSELRLARADCPPRWIAMTLLGHGGTRRTRGPVSCVAVEITQRKQMESELRVQRHLLAHLARVSILGELSAALAHELNQPLTSIMSNAEAAQCILSEASLDIGEVRDILDDIVRDDKRAGDVIGRMRALLTRSETQIQRIDVEQLVDDVLTLEHSDLIARNIQLRCRIPRNLPAVRGDRVELQQVLLNLVLNGCDAMSGNALEERVIELDATVTEDSREVRLSVLDRGGGIAPGQLEKVFEPFFTTKRGGLGVGLAICRSIITAHEGRIWATGGQERGASFHFTVPVFPEERHERAVSAGIHT